MAWNGASGNYYSALGLNVAQNDGSAYSQAASQTLAGASDTGHSVIQDTNLAFELGKQDINRFNTLLGEQGYIDKDGNIHNATGLYGLVNDYALREEKNNEDIARAEAWNQQQIDFDKDIQATGTKSLDDFARYTKDQMWKVLTNGGQTPMASIGDNKDKAMYYLNNPEAAKAALDSKEISQNDYDRLYAASQNYDVSSNITKLNELKYRQQKIDSGWLDDKYLMQQASTMKSAGLWNDRARSTQDIYYALKKEQALSRNQGELLDSQFFVEDYANRNKKMTDLLYKGLNPITQQQPNVASGGGSGTNVTSSSTTQNTSSNVTQNKNPYMIPPSVLNMKDNVDQSSIFDGNGHFTEFGIKKEAERLQLEKDVKNAETDYNNAVENDDWTNTLSSAMYNTGSAVGNVVDWALGNPEGVAVTGTVMIGSPLYNNIRNAQLLEAAGLTQVDLDEIIRNVNGDPKQAKQILEDVAKNIMKDKTKTEQILSKMKNAGIGTLKGIKNSAVAQRTLITLGIAIAAGFTYNMLPDHIKNNITFNDPKDQFKVFMEKWYEPYDGKPAFKDKDGNLNSEYINDLSRLNLDAIDKESNAPMMNVVGVGRYKAAMKMARAHQSMAEYDNAKKDELELNKSGSVANNIADPVRQVRDAINEAEQLKEKYTRIYGNNIPTDKQRELKDKYEQVQLATSTTKINQSNIINQNIVGNNPSLSNKNQSESPSFGSSMIISMIHPYAEGNDKFFDLGDGVFLSKPEKPTVNEKLIETSLNKNYAESNLIFDDKNINVDTNLKATVLLPFIKILNFNNKNAQSFFDALCTDEVIGYELQKLQDSLSLKDGQSVLDRSALFSDKGFVSIDENIKKRIFDLMAEHKPQLLSGFYADNEAYTKMSDESSGPSIRVWSDIFGDKFKDKNGKEIGLIQKAAKVYRELQGPNARNITYKELMLLLGQL